MSKGVEVEFAPTGTSPTTRATPVVVGRPGAVLVRRPVRVPVRRPVTVARRYPRPSLSSRRPQRREIPPYAVVGTILAALCIGGGTVAHTVAPTIAPSPQAAPVCTVADGQPAGPVAGFGGAELANASTILAVGRQLGLPPRAGVVALATAMQESHLRNLTYGDRDSLGLFQQRPSMGWGSPAQVTDPSYAARKFYSVLATVPGWEQLPVTVAAQRVQRSAFPSAYAKWENPATAIAAALTSCTRS